MSYSYQCTGNEAVLSGIGKCSPQFSDVKYALLLPRGQKILKSTLTALAFTGGLSLKVADGTVIPLPRLLVKTPSAVEPKTKEIAGEMQYMGDPEIRAVFTLKNIFGCLQTELRKLNGGNYSIIYIDSNNRFLAREYDATNVKGFSASEIFVTQINPVVANGEKSETDMYVTIDPSEFDGAIAYGTLGFPASDINGMVGCLVDFGTVTTSAIVVTVTESCNSNQPVIGLEAENFTLSQGGVAVSITTVVESTVTPGEYTITATTTANPLSVGVKFDATQPEMLYKSAVTVFTP